MTKLSSFIFFIFLPWSLCAHGISDADKENMVSGGLLDYIWLGASHMVTGYDHLLFLFGVIFFLTKFNDVIKFITAFTLGHCITLIFATFLEITANYYLIDAIIALTVIYKGFDNLDGFKRVFKINSPNLLMLVFIFGLIHGFGLSARLQQLPLGDDGLLIKILSFNIGVEFGQIIALGIMLVLLSAWRKTELFKKFSTASNILIMLIGLGLFVFQMVGFFTEAKAESNIEMVQSNTISIEVKSGKSVEYKFFLSKGSSLAYQWTTNQGELFFDFHGDAEGGGGFQSYEKATKTSSKGVQVIPFNGSHGWYWKNNTAEDISLTLETSGKYKVLGFK